MDSMIGRTMGHYRVQEQIGAGGMGVVYRARDERLERDVAVKVLPAGTLADEAARKRFRKEALALSQLNHPNIATVHDFDTQEGVDFLVMELIPGRTLGESVAGGPLPEREITRLGIQLAQGLAAAHEHGVVHRDLKPGNLRVTPDGRLKILDFGLATLRRSEGDDTPTATLTEQAAVAGTLPYMAPEQLRGEKADARSDIFAAGAVLYEMATGRRPFSQSSGALLIDAILNKAPEPPSTMNRRVSPGLENVILKALDKDPERRYQSSRELAVDLERLSSPSVVAPPPAARRGGLPRRGLVAGAVAAGLLVAVGAYYLQSKNRSGGAIDSIAVLPFENAGADPNAEYLSDGITESLIDSLSRAPRLRVIARATVFRYKGKTADPQAAARDLNVRAVLIGRVAQRGEVLSISAELVDARDNARIWGEQYNRKLADIFTVQEDLARDISEKLHLRLSGEEKKRLARQYTQDTEAYHLYLKGRYYWNRRPQQVRQGIDLFQQAIEKDAGFALAYTGLADSYNTLGSWEVGEMSPQEAMPKAEAAARKALEIDDQLAEAHTSLGYVKLNYYWDWEEARKGLERAIALNPSYATAHHWYSHYAVAVGQPDRALRAARRAIEADPLDLIVNIHLGWTYLHREQYDAAIEQYRKTLEMYPHFLVGHLHLGWAYEQKSMFRDSVAEFEKAAAAAGPESPQILSALGHTHAAAGNRSEALQQLEKLREVSRRRYVPAYESAVIYAGLGETDQAFAWLEKAYQERSSSMIYLRTEPRIRPLRSDRRFQELVRRVGLPQ